MGGMYFVGLEDWNYSSNPNSYGHQRFDWNDAVIMLNVVRFLSLRSTRWPASSAWARSV